MRILAFDFSTDLRSVALLDTDRVGAPAVNAPPDLPSLAKAILGPDGHKCVFHASESGGKTMHAFAMIEAVLAKAGSTREAVDLLAVGLGPGSYTGIRAALAIAQGWHLALNTRVTGVGSITALAFEHSLARNPGTFHVAVDAQRQEFYLSSYHADAGTCVETRPLALVPTAEVERLAQEGASILSPDTGRPGLAGLTRAFPSATWIAALAAVQPPDASPSPETLEPIYLRAAAFVKAPPPRVRVDLDMDADPNPRP